MTLLDCQTVDTARASVAASLGMEEAELERRLKRLEDNPDLVGSWEEFPTPILDAILDGEERDLQHAGTCWFHATRASDLSTFDAGIRPLCCQLDSIWEMLRRLVVDEIGPEEWARRRAEVADYLLVGSGKPVFQVNMDGGPCGFLVLEQALHPERNSCQHDYLKIPETVDIICNTLRDPLGPKLKRRFVAGTRPCIVKFRIFDRRGILLEDALRFLRFAREPDGLDGMLFATFDGEGMAVEACDILEKWFVGLRSDRVPILSQNQ